MAHLVGISKDQYFKCPLVKEDITETDCYDINSVRVKLVVERILEDLDFAVDIKQARKICPRCKYNPMADGTE